MLQSDVSIPATVVTSSADADWAVLQVSDALNTKPLKIGKSNDAQNTQSVYAIGKIEDIFAGSGVTEAVHTKDNEDGMDKTIEALDIVKNGLIFTNLVEFDSTWGHRRDVEGYARGLERFDKTFF